MQPDTTPDLDNLERLEKAATPGPWEWSVFLDSPQLEGTVEAPEMNPVLVARGCGNKEVTSAGVEGCIAGGCEGDPMRGCALHPSEADRALIAAARNALPWLIRAARERDELRSPLWTCVGCGRVERDGWKSQKYEAGDEDIVCPECGSTDVREHPREVLTQVISERDELRAERDAARIALGGHATGDFASDDGCGCTMLGLVRLCETHHDWLKQGQAEIKELRARAERAEARLRELEADVCSVCMGTGLPGGSTSAACPCGDGSRAGELTAPYRARAEKAEADLAESKRLAEKAEARAKELEALVKKWPSLECPCCGEEGAMALFFEDGQETTCGCGGRVSADGESASISIDDSEDECPKCKEPR